MVTLLLLIQDSVSVYEILMYMKSIV